MSPEIIIHNADLAAIQGKVVLLTGCASGICLATAKLLLNQGAHVVAGDICEPKEAISSDRFLFQKTDVTDWDQLKALFKTAVAQHGRIDHVFANAGVAPKKAFVDDNVDEHGEPERPDHAVFNVNLLAVADTVKLALHYLRKNSNGGSIVMTASAASYQMFGLVEYTATKHGVLGLMRGLFKQLHPILPIRLNCIAPAWTVTGMVDAVSAAKAGIPFQEPEAVARSVALLMSDMTRHGQLIYSSRGKFTELEGDLMNAAGRLGKKAAGVEPEDESVDEQRGRLVAVEAERRIAEQ